MLATEPPTTTTAASPHLCRRKPLQPKQNNNIFNFTNNNHYDIIPPKQKQTHFSPLSQSPIISNSNKENDINRNIISMMNVQLMDASLAEELTAVKQKLERLKNDKDKTCELLQQRDRVLEVQMTELMNRGEFQKELEIEVDRLYRLKHLKLACLRMSPIRSLREKEMEKKNNKELEPIVSEEKSREIVNEESVDESSTSDSPTMSVTSSSASASASTSVSASVSASALASVSASTGARSTATSKKLPITLRLLSLETDLDDK